MGERRKYPESLRWRRTESRILDEAPEEIAWVLWQILRHVRDWLGASEAERRNLFPAPPRPRSEERRRVAALAVPELEEAWLTFSEMLRLPTSAATQAVGAACRRVAEWASGRGYTETAVQYIEAAGCEFLKLCRTSPLNSVADQGH